MKTKLFVSKSTNPWFNLAFEEYLVNEVNSDEVYFYLWQNQHTVVIGKHQNPWKEVLVSDLEAADGKLARRLSGGGAVYHDLGNLNFTFVMPKKYEDLHRQLKVIVEAAKSLGVNAHFSGRNDILADDRKFSGNAFYYGKNNYYHHGTILIDVDMPNLGKYLNVSMKKLQSKGVESVKSRVINLKEINPEITVQAMQEALRKAFEKEYGDVGAIYKITENDAPPQALERFQHYASWDWRYGKTPSFDVTFEEKFPWGEVALNFELKGAKTKSCTVYSDAMSTGFIEQLSDALDDIKFESETLAKAIGAIDAGGSDIDARDDVARWVRTLPI